MVVIIEPDSVYNYGYKSFKTTLNAMKPSGIYNDDPYLTEPETINDSPPTGFFNTTGRVVKAIGIDDHRRLFVRLLRNGDNRYIDVRIFEQGIDGEYRPTANGITMHKRLAKYVSTQIGRFF